MLITESEQLLLVDNSLVDNSLVDNSLVDHPLVDNTLSPHGGVLVERIAPRLKAVQLIQGLPQLEVRDQLARETVNIAYGFSPPFKDS